MSWATRLVTGSGAHRSRKASSDRKVPSPSTDRRKEAVAQSGWSKQGLQRGPPTGAGYPERPARQRGPLGEHGHVAGLVGDLGRQELLDLPEVRVDATEKTGRDHQGGLLVFNQIGHDLDDRGLHLVGQVGRRPVDTRGRVPLPGRRLGVQAGGQFRPHLATLVEIGAVQGRTAGLDEGTPGGQPPRARRRLDHGGDASGPHGAGQTAGSRRPL